VLEARGGDDLEDPARLVARVPERVPLVARLVDQVARAGLDDLVAEQRAHAALQDVAVLVLARVEVQRGGEGARRHRVLDQREALAGLRAVDHEADADAAEEALGGVGRADDLRARRRGGGHGSELLWLDSNVARNCTQTPPRVSRWCDTDVR